MTLDHKGGASRNRRPSFKREVYYKVVGNKEVVAAMPRSRGKSTKAKTKEHNDWFLQANWATKYWAPHLQQFYRDWVKGTPLMPRDLMIMTMANRFAMITLSDGRRLYPMPALTDVTQSLDVVGQTPGDMMYRGPSYWTAIPIGEAGQILTLNASSVPVWANGGAGGGGGLYDISMGVPVAPTQVSADPAKFSHLERPTKALNVKYTGGGLGPSLAGYQIPKPATPTWSIAMLALHNNSNASYYAMAIGLRDATSLKLSTFCLFDGVHNAWEIMGWNDYNSRAASVGGAGGVANTSPIWLHVDFDGINFRFGQSKDGANPVWLWSEAIGGFLGTIDDIFIGGFFETANDVPGTSVTILCYDPNAASRVMG